ncbi:Secondary metabolism regulator lae1 [Ciborinia camelliae]|nr:Secondary metabolism regulator lae1 [Ciborinia camelliae]
MVVAMATDNNDGSLPLTRAAALRKNPPDYFENGRLYHGLHRNKYMFPCDEDEKDRYDIFHKFFQVAMGGELHSKNTTFTTSYDGPRILDLGTGTGIWAIDMADKYGSNGDRGEVVGVDLANIQPATIPENLQFQQRDIESPWFGLETESWDMIHIRMLSGGMISWLDIYQKCFRHLKPEIGRLEHVEIDFTPRTDHGEIPPDSALAIWIQKLFEATHRNFRPLAYNSETRDMLQGQGFVDIEEEVIRIPLNPWPDDPREKDVARWYNLALTQGLEAMTLGPMYRMNNWSKDEVTRLITEVRRDICSRKIRAYNNMHIWTARRPPKA